MQRSFLAAIAFLAAGLFAGAAAAANGYTTANVNMRAGPSTNDPIIQTLGLGTPVEIYGCLSAYSWCDTAFAGNRGWIASQYLTTSYQGRVVPFMTVAPTMGIPFITYDRNTYWNQYYIGRPFMDVRPIRPVPRCGPSPFGWRCF